MWYKKHPPILLAITSNRTVRHAATVPPTTAPDKSEAPMEVPATVVNAVVVVSRNSEVEPAVVS